MCKFLKRILGKSRQKSLTIYQPLAFFFDTKKFIKGPYFFYVIKTSLIIQAKTFLQLRPLLLFTSCPQNAKKYLIADSINFTLQQHPQQQKATILAINS